MIKQQGGGCHQQAANQKRQTRDQRVTMQKRRIPCLHATAKPEFSKLSTLPGVFRNNRFLW